MNLKYELDKRYESRLKYLEDTRYRKWSDVTETSSYVYRAFIESGMLASYLAGELRNSAEVDGTDENVIKLIEANLDNPDINWKGLFAYLDERLDDYITEYTLGYEVNTLARLLEPYRDKVLTNSTFIGY